MSRVSALKLNVPIKYDRSFENAYDDPSIKGKDRYFIFPSEADLAARQHDAVVGYLELSASPFTAMKMRRALDNDIEAMNWSAEHFHRIRPKFSFYFYHKSALLNDPHGQWGLATCYIHGIGVSKNAVKAVDLLEQAAAGGSIGARLTLAETYLEGGMYSGGRLVYHTDVTEEQYRNAKACIRSLCQTKMEGLDTLFAKRIQETAQRYHLLK